ncbi:hypothetical protein [Hoeflea poritis]|uniref:ABM domain-containing protein n=1 Tax=Hoeflea poritis TaxID=2993659 RepID=A0ABT4VUL4_9HYPH|nr:hypothetical protein [Hoeflea poritis]MDA4848401.1 hypothetical protein [Hoeflea poritis]
MFTRMTSWQANDAATIRAKVEAKREQIMAVPGLVSCHVVWNTDGSGITFAVYDSQTAAAASTQQIKAIWSDLASTFAATPETMTYLESIDMR